MRSPWYVLGACALGISAACATEMRPKPITVPELKAAPLRIKPASGAIQRIPLEDYVRGTLIAEFDPPGGDPAQVERMLEIQAVIARTYAVAHLSRHAKEGFDLCSTTHCQLYQPARLKTSMWASRAEDATRRTAGMVLWYQSTPASALFHADCGGHTSAAGDVWEGPTKPYLVGKKDDGPAEPAHTTWRFEVETTALLNALNASPRTRVGSRLTDIRVKHRDDAGRAALVTLGGTRDLQVRGEELRAVMARAFGAKSIRSTRFEIARDGGKFVFTGRGFGHGVGLCQTGAFARLQAGARPEQVLARYYPGTRLVVLR
jgi:stage II sporulation protein D